MPDHSDLIKLLRTHADLLAVYGRVDLQPTEAELWAGCKDGAPLLAQAADALEESRARASTDLEYIRHLEGRAKAAEAELAAMKKK